jgi:hypothetical protein
MPVNDALANFTPVKNDIIKSKTGYTSFNGTAWRGTLTTLEPGQGYIYQSKAAGAQELNFSTNK